jgi:hypothetical protein
MIIFYTSFLFWVIGCMCGPWILAIVHDFEKRWHERSLKRVKLLPPFRPWLNMQTGNIENPFKESP